MFEHMQIPLSLFPQHLIDQYDLDKHVLHGIVHLKFCRVIYGLSKDGTLANKQLCQLLQPAIN